MTAIQPITALALGLLPLLVNQTQALATAKGSTPPEAEAQQQAAEIGCASVHENNGRWMPCALMNGSSTDSCASNETDHQLNQPSGDDASIAGWCQSRLHLC